MTDESDDTERDDEKPEWWPDGIPTVPAPDPDGDPTGDDGEDAGDGIPDRDPRHLDPAGQVADAVEGGEIDLTLDDDQDREELREFLDRVEAGEFDADPGLEATVRIVRTLLEESDDTDDADAGEGG